jgi:N-acetylglucosamine-6-phosphate deacetylase
MSTTPARGLGLGAHDLSPGTIADVVVLDDRWEVVRTLVGGEVVAGG